MRRIWLGLGLLATLAVLVTSVAIVAAAGRGPRALVGNGMMGGPAWGPGGGMMGGPAWGPGGGMMGGAGMMGAVWLAGNGAAVASIPGARDRAGTAAASEGLHPGEVIWFDNGFYVELKDAAGDSATEVIVDPASGAVFTEPGPAMMWNTRYGMHGAVNAPNAGPAISAERAQQIAAQWLGANLPGRVAQPPDSYPGYYTLETTTDGTINGMLSVNAATGQVWYHSWHGRFIAREDA
jgi:hypothetical protein